MHVITYSPNFALPPAGGIPKNSPHSTMEDHNAYIYIVSLPLHNGVFSFFPYIKHTLLHGLILYGKG
jgi:hypothetical protein